MNTVIPRSVHRKASLPVLPGHDLPPLLPPDPVLLLMSAPDQADTVVRRHAREVPRHQSRDPAEALLVSGDGNLAPDTSTEPLRGGEASLYVVPDILCLYRDWPEASLTSLYLRNVQFVDTELETVPASSTSMSSQSS